MYVIGEQRVERVAQLVSDTTDLANCRVLDLGCHVGGFSLELARRGAREVVGVEGRETNLTQALAAREEAGLTQVEFSVGDVRELSAERYGEFDVVLCLGLLYHLDAPDLFSFVKRLASVCRGFVLIETNVALKGKERVEHDGRSYWGLWYPEDISQPGASLDNARSFWPTRASLLNLLADAGFTSVTEVLYPVVPKLAPYQDHTLLMAAKGTPQGGVHAERWAEGLARLALPVQGPGWAVRDRFARLRGGGFASLLPPKQ